MKLRLFFLPLFLAVGLGGIYFLPSAGEIAQSAVKMELPKGYGIWQFNKIPASRAELDALAGDTEFSKAICLSVRPGEFTEDGLAIPDRIDLSVVLSGIDINSSIHRPERCMPAQGHKIVSSSDRSIQLDGGKSLEVKRLLSFQLIPKNAERTEFTELKCVTYYFFIGHDQITNSHLGRTLADMKARLLRGMDQRWAYVSVSMWHGAIPWIESGEISIEEADSKAAEFIKLFSEKQINWDQIKL